MNLHDFLKTLSAKEKEAALFFLSSRLSCGRAELLLRALKELPNETLEWLGTCLRRHHQGEPWQYIVGLANFWGRDFIVNSSVLIPRPETELLIELCVKHSHSFAKTKERPMVLDVGTGSGVIGITLSLENPRWNVWASDLSKDALAIAKKNAKKWNAPVTFCQSNFLQEKRLRRPWDLVVSNPPYVRRGVDWVQESVRKYEPEMALYPLTKDRVPSIKNSGAWAAQKILMQCAELRVKTTILELSAGVAYLLERKWKSSPRIKAITRESDLNQRRRFLVVHWH